MILSRLLASVLLVAAPAAFAFDFKSVGAPSVILYDTPHGTRMYVAPRGMPLQVVSTYGEWVKVRDMNGDVAWTETKGLSARRNVVVRTAGAKVFAGPGEGAQVLMTADRGVVLELVDPTALAWIRVRHRDGIAGFMRSNDVWGL